MQITVPPRQQQHVVRRDVGASGVVGKVFEVDGDVFCLLGISRLIHDGDGGQGIRGEGTNLRPHQLRQRADELRCGVTIPAEGLFVDDLADGEPEGFFEALGGC